MKPLTPKQQAMLDYCLAHPKESYLQVARALGVGSIVAWKRIDSLRCRGLLPRRARPHKTSGATVRRFLSSIRKQRRVMQNWKDGLGLRGRLPELWLEIDFTLGSLAGIEEKLTKILQEMDHDKVPR